MVRVCSAGVTIVQWLTMIAMELICMDFSETIMARGTIRCLRWGRQEALHDATWSRSWKNPEMKNLCRHHQSSYFTSLNNSTVKLGRFYNMFSITFGGEVTGHYKIHPKMILFMVQKSQTTTVWMVLKPVVNNGINLPFPQLVSQISEPSTVWNSSKDDICVCVYHKVLFLCVCVFLSCHQAWSSNISLWVMAQSTFFPHRKNRPKKGRWNMKHHSYIQFQKTNGPVSQVKCSKVTNVTPPKFNIAPEKWWLEDYFPIGKVAFQGAMLNFGRVIL